MEKNKKNLGYIGTESDLYIYIYISHKWFLYERKKTKSILVNVNNEMFAIKKNQTKNKTT